LTQRPTRTQLANQNAWTDDDTVSCEVDLRASRCGLVRHTLPLWATITPHAYRAQRPRFARDRAPVCFSHGLGILPFIYLATGFPRIADYSFRAAQAWMGLFVAIASLTIFRMTHKALGRNWSVSLDVRESHKLVSDGIYRQVRHPMYTAFWLWAVAQALLLPNWFAGCAGLVGFGILFFGRVAKEEELMLESFGDEYRGYMSRTYRVIPWVY
jgi:protein-S-isoprenylcysteine O-methyltransferase Ste14